MHFYVNTVGIKVLIIQTQLIPTLKVWVQRSHHQDQWSIHPWRSKDHESHQGHRDEILLNPDWMDADGDVTYTKTVTLAPLPGQLFILNGLTMKCLLRGILNDFKVTFKSRKPVWWPTHLLRVLLLLQLILKVCLVFMTNSAFCIVWY